MHKTMVASGDMIQQALQQALAQNSATQKNVAGEDELVLHKFNEEEVEEDFILDSDELQYQDSPSELLEEPVEEPAEEAPVEEVSVEDFPDSEPFESDMTESVAEPWVEEDTPFTAAETEDDSVMQEEWPSFQEPEQYDSVDEQQEDVLPFEEETPLPVLESVSERIIDNPPEPSAQEEPSVQAAAEVQQVEPSPQSAQQDASLVFNAAGWDQLLEDVRTEHARVQEIRGSIQKMAALLNEITTDLKK